jgi:hypothetical protein
MRQLEASIMTFNLDRVKVSLTHFGVTGLQVFEAERALMGPRPFFLESRGSRYQ